MAIYQPYSGHYFMGLLYQYDISTNDYFEPPKKVRFRPHDLSQRDIGTGIKDDVSRQELQGFALDTNTMVIQVLDNFNITTKDMFKDLTDGKRYRIVKIARGYDSISAISNLMFPTINNRPTILFLGDM